MPFHLQVVFSNLLLLYFVALRYTWGDSKHMIPVSCNEIRFPEGNLERVHSRELKFCVKKVTVFQQGNSQRAFLSSIDDEPNIRNGL
jgi:hypothetical protein